MWLKREAAGNVYAFWATDDNAWTPHASHHASGDRHVKSHGRGRILARTGQRPAAAFVGSEQLITTPISLDVVRRLNRPCVAAAYAGGVVTIPAAAVDAVASVGRTAVAVDLVEPGAPPVIYPLTAALQRTVFDEAVPHISVTLWDQSQMFAPGPVAAPPA
jgi:hypothetical protein